MTYVGSGCVRSITLRRWSMGLILALTLLGLSASPSHAQVLTHKATLTWVDANNPSGVTYTVLRATGLCSGTPSFSVLASGITALTYVDSTVTPGNYCYEVEASVGGVLSAPSNAALAPVPAFAVTNLQVTVQ